MEQDLHSVPFCYSGDSCCSTFNGFRRLRSTSSSPLVYYSFVNVIFFYTINEFIKVLVFNLFCFLSDGRIINSSHYASL
jgi:hypothetical protein